MTAYGIELIQQATFILGRHDPAGIYEGNPDAPPDEYEDEAEKILSSRLRSEEATLEIVRRVLQGSFSGEPLDKSAMVRVARDIYYVTSNDSHHGRS